MKQALKKEIVTKLSMDVYTLNKSCFIKTKNEEFFVDRKEFENKVGDPFDFIDSLNRYYLYGKEFWEELNKFGVNDKLFKIMDSPLKVNVNDFKENTRIAKIEKGLIYFKSYDHTFFKLGAKYSMSIPQFVDYIGGIDNEIYELDKAFKILSRLQKTGRVWSIKKISIPYYNKTENRDEALEFFFKISQKTHEKYIKLYEANREQYTPRIVPWDKKSKYDVLGLKSALLDKKNE